MSDLRYCQHEDVQSWWEYDARGIPLTKVCARCRKAKLETYSPEVLRNPGYDVDEPIEEDGW